MELIRRIKQAETQAQGIIEQAKADSARATEAARISHHKAIEQGEQNRMRAVESAVSAAESQAKVEVGRLKADAERKLKELRDKATGRKQSAVVKVVTHIKG